MKKGHIAEIEPTEFERRVIRGIKTSYTTMYEYDVTHHEETNEITVRFCVRFPGEDWRIDEEGLYTIKVGYNTWIQDGFPQVAVEDMRAKVAKEFKITPRVPLTRQLGTLHRR